MDRNPLDEAITISVAASRLKVSESLIRKWASRYKLPVDQRGLYRFGDLVEVEFKTRNARGSRRKLTKPERGVTLRAVV